MQPQSKFAEATKNTLLYIAELNASHNLVSRIHKRKRCTHKAFIPQKVSSTNRFIHKPSTHKGWA
jgi:hypothetical protein